MSFVQRPDPELAATSGQLPSVREAGFAGARAGAGVFEIRIDQSKETFPCRPTESVLQGMGRLGRRAIPAGCVNGGCGVCKVAILTGEFMTGAMSRAHVSEAEEQGGIVLACKVFPRSNLSLKVVGKIAKSVGVLIPGAGLSRASD